ncbi:MAG: hypothetical protein AAF220_05810 [Pseudomonadota bacterium]
MSTNQLRTAQAATESNIGTATVNRQHSAKCEALHIGSVGHEDVCAFGLMVPAARLELARPKAEGF